MKTEIYYFSGTGNSLNVAQNLSKKFEHSEIISIPHVINKTNNITGEIIGIVCPIYFHNMPSIIRDFVKKIKEVKYLFIVYAGAGDLGLCVKRTKKFFIAQNINLSSLFSIPMPDNSTLHVKSEEKQKEMFNNVEKKTDDIVKIVNGKREYFDRNTSSLYETFIDPGIMAKFVYRDINKLDKDFITDEKCIGCSTCREVCPVDNITMKDNKPVWKLNNRCQACLACYNWCQNGSIKHVSVNPKIERYHNPNIKVKDIIRSSAEV